jgi:hypothetical protein
MNNKRSKKLEQLIEETGHFLQMKQKFTVNLFQIGLDQARVATH